MIAGDAGNAPDQQHNITDFEWARRDFRWECPPDFNFALDTIGRWAEDPEKLAVLWVGADGREERHTFVDFDEQSSRAAHAFEQLGIKKGDHVLIMLPRVPEWWEVVLGLMKLGAVAIPCTTLLTPKDIQYRSVLASPVAMITDKPGAEKLDKVRAQCPTIQHAIVVGQPGDECPTGCVNYRLAADPQPPTWYARRTAASDPCLIYFTSGTVGYPKMVLHTHASYPMGHTPVTGRYWLDLRPDDLMWDVSEAGWANFLDLYFSALPPDPDYWCPLDTATPDTPRTEPCFLLDQACRIVPGAYWLLQRSPSLDQGQG